MKWYFFYTPNYHFYKNHIENRLNNSNFEVEPILLNELKLSNTGHHFLNNTVKIELVIDCIKKNIGNYIIFSDATIYINDKVDDLYNYIISKKNTGIDMHLTEEYQHLNIGFMLINCNENTLSFFENILNTMNEKLTNNINTHDQSEINDLISKNKMNISRFEREYIWCSDYIYSPVKESFFVFKITVDLNSHITRHNQRINALYNLNFISVDEYNKNIE
jgi:hypothetical protein